MFWLSPCHTKRHCHNICTALRKYVSALLCLCEICQKYQIYQLQRAHNVLTASLRLPHNVITASLRLPRNAIKAFHNVKDVLTARKKILQRALKHRAPTVLLAFLHRASWLPALIWTLWERCKKSTLV